MDRYLSDNKDWFEEAEHVIRRHTITPCKAQISSQALPLSVVDRSVDYDRLVENMMTKPSSTTDALMQWDKIHGKE